MSATSRRSAASGQAVVSTRHAYLLLLSVIVLWGANWPIMKVGLESITPLWFSLSRLGMGAVTLFAVLAFTGRLQVPRRGDLPVLFSVSLLQMAGFLVFVNMALLDVEAGRAAILAYTTPLWVAPAAILLLGERVDARKAMGLALGLGGVVVLFNPLGFDWSDHAVVRGNALLMLAALAWSVAILHVRAHRWVSSPLQLAPWQMMTASPLVLALALLFEGDATIAWSAELVAILFYNGPIGTAFCFWAAVTVTRSLPAVSTSLGFLGVPAAGLAASTAALGEPLTATLIAGFALVAGGLALVNIADFAGGKRRKER